MLAVALWLLLLSRLLPSPPRASRGRRFVPAALPALRTRKPERVIDEVVRLKALMPDAGCRRIADTFNRLHAARHAMTVSKSWVATAVRKHRLEIEERRRQWKRHIPPRMPVNRVWGVDLTGKTDLLGRTHPILGVVDHGSRLAVALRALPDKASITLLRAVLDAIERHGLPNAIRTDNEAVFTSRLFRFSLWTLRIAHQRTEPHSPWQNGRAERFFGTLKEKLDGWQVDSLKQLALALGDFRA